MLCTLSLFTPTSILSPLLLYSSRTLTPLTLPLLFLFMTRLKNFIWYPPLFDFILNTQDFSFLNTQSALWLLLLFAIRFHLFLVVCWVLLKPCFCLYLSFPFFIFSLSPSFYCISLCLSSSLFTISDAFSSTPFICFFFLPSLLDSFPPCVAFLFSPSLFLLRESTPDTLSFQWLKQVMCLNLVLHTQNLLLPKVL